MRFNVKKIVWLALLICFVGLAFCESVFADVEGGSWIGQGGAGGGSSDNSGGGYDGIADCYGDYKHQSYMWRVDCTGVSWAYYKAISPTRWPVPFDYVDNVAGSVRAQISPLCSQNDGGFWHLGVNSRGAHVETHDGNSTIYTGSGGYYGHWTTITMNYNSENGGIAPLYNINNMGIPLQNVGGVYQLDHYGTIQEVLAAYNKASHQTASSLPSDLWAFCSWEGEVGEYYAKSNISDSREGDYVSTGRVSSEGNMLEAALNTRTISVGDIVELRFSHNIYASAKDDAKTHWKVDRSGNGWNNSDVRVQRINSPGVDISSEGDAIMDEEMKDGEETLYRPSNRPFDNPPTTDRYLSRDVYELDFMREGVYEFCESISMSNSKIANPKTMTKVCVTYDVVPNGPCYRWRSESYFDGKTSVISKVKFYGESDDKYKDEIYAKPTDKVEWVHCYYPGVQRLANSVASTNGWGNSFSVIDGNNKKVNAIGSSDEKLIGNYRTGTTTPLTYNGGSYRIGDSSIKYLYDKGSAPTFQGVKVEMRNVGAKITDSLGGGLIEENKSSTPVEKTLDYFDLSLYARDEARVKVPYNFINEIKKVDLSEKVYAGETITLSGVTVYVRTRRNEELNATYATRVDDAKVKLISYIPGSGGQGSDPIGPIDDISSLCSKLGSSCSDSPEENSSFNKGDDGLRLGSDEMTRVRDDGEFVERSFSLDVNDVAAGTKYCVVAAVYPYTSGGDLNVSPSGDGRWYVSAPSCATVAKRPSLQVWGTGLYTTGSVKTGVAEKTNLGGNKLSGSAVVFGSWVETSIFAGGKVEGLASGAATGFAGSTAKTYKDNAGKSFGGSLETNPSSSFCEIRSPLTMPSLACTRSSGGSGGSTTSDGDFISRLDAMKNELGDKFTYVKLEKPGQNNVYSLSTLLNQTNHNNQVNRGQTIVFDAKDQTILIDNVGVNTYTDERYSDLSDIPKLIIRAGDIYIDCEVQSISAVLIADRTVNGKMVGKVDTCVAADWDYNTNEKTKITILDSSDQESLDSSIRSNPLKIYGTIIAGSLEANRTFGAGTGEYSVIPAEIIDYDTSLYLWSALTDSTSTGDKLETTYIKELPPRY